MRKNQRAMLLSVAVLAAAAAGTGCGRKEAVPSVQPSESETASETGTEETEPAEPESSTAEEPATIAPFPDVETPETTHAVLPEEDEEEKDWDHNLILGTDIHYLSRELTDGGSCFQYMVEHGDGKVVTYIDQITDAFLDEVIGKAPEVLILSGDLTLDGEKKSHEELAQKLYRVEAAGIPVLVIPGNHDINNHHACEFYQDERRPAEYTSPEQFREIYRDFGYDEAVSEDTGSLSYSYDLNPGTRFLMIDSCQYKPQAKVGGAILSDTYDWIEEQLSEAWDEGMNVIPVAHHNLLDESEVYVDDCTIEHGEQLARMLDEWNVPVFLSGHLHVQHAARSEENKGVWEVVTSSLATPACQYGQMYFDDNGDFSYHTVPVDIQGWARSNNRSEKDLLNFNEFKEPFLRRVFYNQAYDALVKSNDDIKMGLTDELQLDPDDEKTAELIERLTEEQRVSMANFYSDLNYHYYQGDTVYYVDGLMEDPGYEQWMEEGAGTVLCDYVSYIVRDAVMDYNRVRED